MANFPISKKIVVRMAPSQTSYQSTGVSGSHLNIIAKSSVITAKETTRLVRCRSHSSMYPDPYLPMAASAVVTRSETNNRKPSATVSYTHLRAHETVLE